MSAAREELRITPATPYGGALEVWFAVVSPFQWDHRNMNDRQREKYGERTELNFVHGAGSLFVSCGGLDKAELYTTRAMAKRRADSLGGGRRAIKVAVPPQWGKRQ